MLLSKKFVAGNAMPLVIEFNQETAQKIFPGEIKSHAYILSAKADGYKSQVEMVKEVAAENKGDPFCYH